MKWGVLSLLGRKSRHGTAPQPEDERAGLMAASGSPGATRGARQKKSRRVSRVKTFHLHDARVVAYGEEYRVPITPFTRIAHLVHEVVQLAMRASVLSARIADADGVLFYRDIPLPANMRATAIPPKAVLHFHLDIRSMMCVEACRAVRVGPEQMPTQASGAKRAGEMPLSSRTSVSLCPSYANDAPGGAPARGDGGPPLAYWLEEAEKRAAVYEEEYMNDLHRRYVARDVTDKITVFVELPATASPCCGINTSTPSPSLIRTVMDGVGRLVGGAHHADACGSSDAVPLRDLTAVAAPATAACGGAQSACVTLRRLRVDRTFPMGTLRELFDVGPEWALVFNGEWVQNEHATFDEHGVTPYHRFAFRRISDSAVRRLAELADASTLTEPPGARGRGGALGSLSTTQPFPSAANGGGDDHHLSAEAKAECEWLALVESAGLPVGSESDLSSDTNSSYYEVKLIKEVEPVVKGLVATPSEGSDATSSTCTDLDATAVAPRTIPPVVTPLRPLWRRVSPTQEELDPSVPPLLPVGDRCFPEALPVPEPRLTSRPQPPSPPRGGEKTLSCESRGTLMGLSSTEKSPSVDLAGDVEPDAGAQPLTPHRAVLPELRIAPAASDDPATASTSPSEAAVVAEPQSEAVPPARVAESDAMGHHRVLLEELAQLPPPPVPPALEALPHTPQCSQVSDSTDRVGDSYGSFDRMGRVVIRRGGRKRSLMSLPEFPTGNEIYEVDTELTTPRSSTCTPWVTAASPPEACRADEVPCSSGTGTPQAGHTSPVAARPAAGQAPQPAAVKKPVVPLAHPIGAERQPRGQGRAPGTKQVAAGANAARAAGTGRRPSPPSPRKATTSPTTTTSPRQSSSAARRLPSPTTRRGPLRQSTAPSPPSGGDAAGRPDPRSAPALASFPPVQLPVFLNSTELPAALADDPAVDPGHRGPTERAGAAAPRKSEPARPGAASRSRSDSAPVAARSTGSATTQTRRSTAIAVPRDAGRRFTTRSFELRRLATMGQAAGGGSPSRKGPAPPVASGRDRGSRAGSRSSSEATSTGCSLGKLSTTALPLRRETTPRDADAVQSPAASGAAPHASPPEPHAPSPMAAAPWRPDPDPGAGPLSIIVVHGDGESAEEMMVTVDPGQAVWSVRDWLLMEVEKAAAGDTPGAPRPAATWQLLCNGVPVRDDGPPQTFAAVTGNQWNCKFSIRPLPSRVSEAAAAAGPPQGGVEHLPRSCA